MKINEKNCWVLNDDRDNSPSCIMPVVVFLSRFSSASLLSLPFHRCWVHFPPISIRNVALNFDSAVNILALWFGANVTSAESEMGMSQGV